MNTGNDEVANAQKALIIGDPGAGKTSIAKHYAARFGRGLILSMESGLSSVRSAGLDYVPITSWDGTHAPDDGVYSFKGVCRFVASPEFKAAGYKWIMADSLTELSDMCWEPIEAEAKAKAAAKNKEADGFKVWNDYAAAFVGACKWLRDRNCHVIMTALAKSKDDDNGEPQVLPHVRGNAVAAQVCGLYDYVFGLVRVTVPASEGQEARVDRYLITGAYKGWACKARDEHGRLKLVEKTSDVAELITRVNMTPEEFAGQRWANPLGGDE